MGIFQSTTGESGNILLPVQFGNKLYILHPNNNLTSQTISLFPLYIREEHDFRIITFNSSLNSGTIELKQAKHDIKITLAGFPKVTTFDQQYVYVFASIIKKNKSVLYVIARKTGKMQKAIPLQIEQAGDMQILRHKLWVTSTSNQKKLGRIDLGTWKITYIPLPDKQPEYLLPINNQLLITYQGSNTITLLDCNTLHVMEQITLPQPVFKAKVKGKQLYVLSQLPGSGQGIIGVYDIKNRKLIKKIMLPAVRNTLIQDFIIY